MARENGINELVGQIGKRSTVANNDQIVKSVSIGVSKGVADAVEQALAPYLAQIVQNLLLPSERSCKTWLYHHF